ncbi:MAG TPA: RelA/SpoT domain-containing protein [Solirubrobacterales bacterium]|nr:RelA/SpoT domain-containing protein [Solirubrobacterales bacterium]
MTFSKSEVNRAGRFFADQFRKAAAGERKVGEQRADVERTVEVIEWWRSEHARPLSLASASLGQYASEMGKPFVAQRLKKFPTIIGKLTREPKTKLSRMGDIGGVRAVPPDQDAAYRVAEHLRRDWTIVKFHDYVSEPKADGYRALHLIARVQDRLIEVQLRTPLQDNWANLAEILSRLGAPDLKFGGGPPQLREYLAVLSETHMLREQGLPLDSSLHDRLWELQRLADTFVDNATDDSA